MLYETQFTLGVDPGLHGALVVYEPAQKLITNSRVIPTLVLKRNGKHKLILDIPNLVRIVNELAAEHRDLVAFLELVGAHRMRGRTQGASSMFSFGTTSGAIETAVVAAGIPYEKVTPGKWKTTLACPQDKDAALIRASELIPAGTAHWTPKRGFRTKEDCKGAAEAAMIAYWGAHHANRQAVKLAA